MNDNTGDIEPKAEQQTATSTSIEKTVVIELQKEKAFLELEIKTYSNYKADENNVWNGFGKLMVDFHITQLKHLNTILDILIKNESLKK